MRIFDRVGAYDSAEFADNPEARCSIVLVLDVSGSMRGRKLDTVKRALVKFRDIIQEDPVTALRADIAIVTFSGDARISLDFTNGTDFQVPRLSLRHTGTNFSKAVNLALDIIEARKRSYRDGGIAYYRSLAYFLTDGEPEGDDPRALDRAADRLAKAEKNRGVAFFAFQIGGRVTKELARLAPPGRPPVALANMEQLDGSIQWLSRSVAAVSQSQPGANLRLPQQNFLNL